MRAVFFYVQTQKLDSISFGETSGIKKVKSPNTISCSLVAGIHQVRNKLLYLLGAVGGLEEKL